MAPPTSTSKPLPYTANPLLLMLNDLELFLQITFTWPITAGLLSTVIPLLPARSGALDELAFTGPNLWAIFQHLVLIIGQTAFLLSLIPLALFGLPVFYFLYITGFVLGNQWVTGLLNGPRQQGLFQSHPDCVKGDWPKHDNEKWVFINGVAVGSHWLQSNLDLLAMTFRRPVFGIHNQTRGIIFDVLECIIQRDLSFATLDIRTAYAALLEILSDDKIHKVVLILHSQGGIEGGLVLDWLYDTVPADQLRKLEIYTFGNAANHWNAPVVSSSSSRSNRQASITNSAAAAAANGDRMNSQRIVQHIEHYANEGDYVSKFGILHFRRDQARLHNAFLGGNVPPTPQPPGLSPINVAHDKVPVSASRRPPKLKTASIPRSRTWTTSPQTPMERRDLQLTQENNRFFGRLFKRASSGHMLNQHYLDNMFEMEGVDPRDRSKGHVRPGNAFMDQVADMAVVERWDTVQAVGEAQSGDAGAGSSAGANGTQIKQLSRLWEYCNGGSPRD